MLPIPARATVLIVDDDRLNRNALGDLLQGECRVLMAREGQSALQVMAQDHVDLVLLDVSMPGISGYDVLRAMRADDRLALIPVIFITAMSEEADEEFGLSLGAADFVHKPFRPAIVKARVKTHLSLARQRRDLEILASRDGLTGIANRRGFDDRLARILRERAGSGGGLALGLIDIDHFKQYNDFYGHSAGDAALRRVAQLLAEVVPNRSDLVARYGGEEFVLLLGGQEDILTLMEQARAKVAAAAIRHEMSPTARYLTISGGAAMLPEIGPDSGKRLLDLADQALYRAKAAGRNRVVMGPPA